MVEPFLRVTVNPQAGVTQNASGLADPAQPCGPRESWNSPTGVEGWCSPGAGGGTDERIAHRPGALRSCGAECDVICAAHAPRTARRGSRRPLGCRRATRRGLDEAPGRL